MVAHSLRTVLLYLMDKLWLWRAEHHLSHFLAVPFFKIVTPALDTKFKKENFKKAHFLSPPIQLLALGEVPALIRLAKSKALRDPPNDRSPRLSE